MNSWRELSRRCAGAAALALILLAGAPNARAQNDAKPGISLTGIELQLGVVAPDNAETAPAFSGRLGLGSLSSMLLVGAGVTYWSSDIDRKDLGTDVNGSISDLAIDVDGRLLPFKVKAVRPYVLGGLAIHRASADIGSDRSLDEALTGTNVGVDLGLGIESAAGGIGWRAEFRRRIVDDVDNWQLMAGARYTLGGPATRR